MSKQQHTPGPWTVNDAGPKSGNVIRFEIDAENMVRICEIEDPEIGDDADATTPEQAVANANLIAAAPDLIAACKALLQHFWVDCSKKTKEGFLEDHPSHPVHKWIDAVAKAEGRGA